jgi:serine/threonine-protein kinase
LVGRTLGGRYRLEDRTVGDGVSTAYTAIDLQLERTVVVRVLAQYLADDAAFVRRFRTEAQVAATLDHPNLVRVEDWGVESVGDRSIAYLVVEQLTGGTLQDIVDRGRQLSPSQALLVGLDVCRGLDYAHKRGVVHQEIRPGNIVFGDDRRARVANLGLARALAEDVWSNPSSVEQERALYASPEQGLGRPIDDRTDVYSLVLTLIQAVTGQVPFAADSTVATLSTRVDKLMPVSADLGPLASVFEKAGRPDPAERSTAAEFGRALVQIAENLPRPAPLPIVSSGLFESPTPGRPRPAVAQDAAPHRDTAPVDPTMAAPALTMREQPLDVQVTGAPPAGTGAPPASHALRWIAAAVLVVVLAVGGVLLYQSMSQTTNAVPELVGLSAGEAENQVAEFGWDVSVVEEASEDVARGNVIRSEPAEGAVLGSGDPFQLVVSSGPPPATLVDLVGSTLEDARASMEERGLVLEIAERVNDERVKKGVVISWDVPEQPGQQSAGEEVLQGTTVTVVVSDGPAPREVPNVIGVPFRDASAEFEELDLVVVRAEDVFSDSIPQGSVVSQSVQGGESVRRGTEVTLTVSKGPDLVTVPRLRGLDFAGLRNALTDAGFVVGEVTGPRRGELVDVLVDGEPVRGGDQFPRGTVVDILFF